MREVEWPLRRMKWRSRGIQWPLKGSEREWREGKRRLGGCEGARRKVAWRLRPPKAGMNGGKRYLPPSPAATPSGRGRPLSLLSCKDRIRLGLRAACCRFPGASLLARSLPRGIFFHGSASVDSAERSPNARPRPQGMEARHSCRAGRCMENVRPEWFFHSPARQECRASGALARAAFVGRLAWGTIPVSIAISIPIMPCREIIPGFREKLCQKFSHRPSRDLHRRALSANFPP